MRISDWSSDVCSSDLQLLAQRSIVQSPGAGLPPGSRRSTTHGAAAGAPAPAHYGGVAVLPVTLTTDSEFIPPGGVSRRFMILPHGPTPAPGILRNAHRAFTKFTVKIGRAHV